MTEEELKELMRKALLFGEDWLWDLRGSDLTPLTSLMMGITSLATKIWEHYGLLPKDDMYPYDLLVVIAKEEWDESGTETSREG